MEVKHSSKDKQVLSAVSKLFQQLVNITRYLREEGKSNAFFKQGNDNNRRKRCVIKLKRSCLHMTFHQSLNTQTQKRAS